jgi:hypothetical protein
VSDHKWQAAPLTRLAARASPYHSGVHLLYASPWEFGWDALVAIGTLALASGTVFLAWTSSNLAQTSEADLRAQWRPVLLVPPVVESRDGTTIPGISYTAERLRVHVENVGRGPALYLEAKFAADEMTERDMLFRGRPC